MDLSISSGPSAASPAGSTRPAAPGMMRGLLPHLMWEGLLLVIVAAVGIALAAKQSGVFTRGGLESQLAVAVMFATALALSFRTATPNLAVTGIGLACGWWYASLLNQDVSAVVAWLVVVLAAAVIGVVLALLVGLTPLPGWAVSLVALFVVTGIVLAGDNVGTRVIRDGAPGRGAFVAWMVVAMLGSVAGGVLFAVPGIRAGLSRNRREPGADPPSVGGKLVGALVGLGGSSVLAGIAGVLFTLRLHAATPNGFNQGVVFAATLLAGVSVLGRRGGILGVVLGATLVVFVQTWLSLDGVGAGVQLLTLGVLGLVGLLVNALIEWLGRWAERPRAAPPPAPAWNQPVYGPGQPFVPSNPTGPAGAPGPAQP